VTRDRPTRSRTGRTRSEIPRILVVCGGVRTETDYLDALRRLHPGHVIVLLRSKGVDPAGCIRYAVAQSRVADTAYSEVWCVVDVDEFDLDAAARQAAEADVQLAVSNPCFELWLLLHLTDAGRNFADARDVARELRRALPGYDKTRLVFDDFVGGIDKAVERARRLEKDGAGGMPNPSSGMWRLVTRIVGEGQT